MFKEKYFETFELLFFNFPANNRSERGEKKTRAKYFHFIVCKKIPFIKTLANIKSRNYRMNSPKEFRFDNNYSMFSARGLLLFSLYVLNQKYVNIST